MYKTYSKIILSSQLSDFIMSLIYILEILNVIGNFMLVIAPGRRARVDPELDFGGHNPESDFGGHACAFRQKFS